MIQIPYDIIFVGADCSWDEQAQMNLATDMIFLFDMLVSLNTAYYDEMAHLVRSRRAIVNHYLRRHTPHAVAIEPSLHAARICGSLSRGWFVMFILNTTYCELSKRSLQPNGCACRGWFAFDLLSSLPLDRLACAIRHARTDAPPSPLCGLRIHDPRSPRRRSGVG